jgi:hypothetical protein
MGRQSNLFDFIDKKYTPSAGDWPPPRASYISNS